MEQLKKVLRVIAKRDPTAPHETLLVIDATTGQNALSQARQFHAAANITGIVLTKMGGTAKGGIIFALAEQLGIPVRFIGVGEQLDDLQAFDAPAFADALLDQDHSSKKKSAMIEFSRVKGGDKKPLPRGLCVPNE